MKIEEQMIKLAYETEIELLKKQTELAFARGDFHHYYNPEDVLKKYLRCLISITPLSRAMSED